MSSPPTKKAKIEVGTSNAPSSQMPSTLLPKSNVPPTNDVTTNSDEDDEDVTEAFTCRYAAEAFMADHGLVVHYSGNGCPDFDGLFLTKGNKLQSDFQMPLFGSYAHDYKLLQTERDIRYMPPPLIRLNNHKDTGEPVYLMPGMPTISLL